MNVTLWERADVYGLKKNLAVCWQIFNEEHLKESCFTRARMTNDRDEFTWIDLESNVVEGNGFVWVDLRDLIKMNHDSTIISCTPTRTATSAILKIKGRGATSARPSRGVTVHTTQFKQIEQLQPLLSLNKKLNFAVEDSVNVTCLGICSMVFYHFVRMKHI